MFSKLQVLPQKLVSVQSYYILYDGKGIEGYNKSYNFNPREFTTNLPILLMRKLRFRKLK